MLHKQLAVAGPVLRAAWCYFQNTGPDAILCLLHDGALSCYTQDGDCHAIPLPGHFTGLWPLPQGVLLTVRCWEELRGHSLGPAAACLHCPRCRCCIPPPSHQARRPAPHNAPAPAPWPRPALQGAPEHGPCILMHPLENIQEVEMAEGAPGAWDAEARVVWSGAEVPYLVTHNAVSWAAGAERWGGAAGAPSRQQ